jgi:hypothetical protein
MQGLKDEAEFRREGWVWKRRQGLEDEAGFGGEEPKKAREQVG